MFKLNIDEQMINFIKETREKYNVKSSDLATKIGKSNAYVSKFDKNEYKSMSFDEFCQMCSALCDKSDAINEVEISEEGKKLAESFLTNLLLNDEDNIYDDDCGLLTFDDVYRTIEVPSELVDYINTEIVKSNLLLSDIIARANSNVDLSDEINNDNKYEHNVYFTHIKGGKTEISIKVKLSEQNITRIFSKEIKSTNYITIQALLYTIYRLKDLSEAHSQLMAQNIMSSFHFNNLKGIRVASYALKSKERASRALDDMPTFFVQVLSNYTNLICNYYNHNKFYTTAKVYGLHKNLVGDAPLVVTSLDLPLFKMKDLDTDKKREFLKEIKQVITKYTEKKPENEEYKLI